MANGQTGEWSQRDSGQAADERLANGLGWFSIGLGLAEVIAPGKVAELIGVNDDDRTRTLLRAYGAREIAAGIGILSQPRPAGWVWGRVAGDVLDLATLAAALQSDSTNRTRLAAATAAVLGVTALDVLCGQQLSRKDSGETDQGDVPVVKTVNINRSPQELYEFWRDFRNLPRFMNHLESVEVRGSQSHWKAKAPLGTTVEWDAEIVDDRPGSLISWRSLPNSDVDNSGVVRFERATGGRGTNVRVELRYAPPGGMVGAAFAKLFGEEPSQQVDDDLRAFKQIMETGDVVKSDASIHKGMHPAQPPAAQEESLVSR